MYPKRFSLSDGQQAALRPMRFDDLPAINAMHDRLSKQSLYLRYFAGYRPSLEALAGQVRSSLHGGAGLVAALDAAPLEIVAMAFYLRQSDDPGAAEVALVVEDRFQGLGLGHVLFSALIDTAQSESLRSLRLNILPENRGMFHILDRYAFAFAMQRRYVDGMVEVRLQMQPGAVEILQAQG